MLKKSNTSVIIPCYNSHKFLPRALDSISKQTLPFSEVIIINDGSTNVETLKYLDKIKKDFFIFNQKNKGLASARNKGAQLSTSNWITFLDCDDWLENSANQLFSEVNHSNNYDKSIFYYSDLLLSGEKSGLKSSTFNKFEQHLMNGIPYSIYINRKIFLNCGGYDESFTKGYEDWEFNLRLIFKKINGQKIPQPVFNYYISSSGMLKKDSNKNHNIIFNKIINKHSKHYSLKNLFILFICNFYKKSQKNSILLFVFFIITFLFKKNLTLKFLRKWERKIFR